MFTTIPRMEWADGGFSEENDLLPQGIDENGELIILHMCTKDFEFEDHRNSADTKRSNICFSKDISSEWTSRQILDVVTYVIEEICTENIRHAKYCPTDRPEHIFSDTFNHTTIKHHIYRIMRRSQYPPSVFIVMMIYLDRIGIRATYLTLTRDNIHMLINITVLMASKF